MSWFIILTTIVHQIHIIYNINIIVVEEWISVFDRKILSWEELKTTLTDKEAARLGRKDAEGYPFVVAGIIVIKHFCPKLITNY